VFETGYDTAIEYLESRGLRFASPKDWTVVITTLERAIPQIITDLSGLGATITDIDIRKPDLEDVFLQIARRRYVLEAS
jgi:hypothetical protein